MSCHKPSEHHIVPKSRGGRETCVIPKNFHESWHQCFENMTPKEIVIFVEKIQGLMRTRRMITWEDINTIRNAIKGGG